MNNKELPLDYKQIIENAKSKSKKRSYDLVF